MRFIDPNGRQEYDPNCSGCGIVPVPSPFGVQVMPSFHEDDLVGQAQDAISRQIQQAAATAMDLIGKTAINWATMFIGPLEAAPAGLIAGRAAVEAGGFRFTEFYLTRLVSTGRANAVEAAGTILKAGAKEFEPLAVMVGRRPGETFFLRRGTFGGKLWEMVFNPKTKEVYHIQPVKKVEEIITAWR